MKSMSMSLESIPQSSGFFCLSLKFGAIVSSLIAILYSSLAVAECIYALTQISYMLQASHYGAFLMYTMVIVMTICNSITFTLSFHLLIGVLKEKTQWIRPWIVWISFMTIAYICVFVYSSTLSLVSNIGDGTLMFYFIDFLILVIRVYMLIIVSSFYKQLQRNQEEGYKIITRHLSYTA